MLSQEKTTNGYASEKSTVYVVKDAQGRTYLIPEFHSETCSIMNDFHNYVQPSIDRNVPFITEWFAGFLHSKKFHDLSEKEKDQTLWMYEKTKEMWNRFDELAANTGFGAYEPTCSNFQSIQSI